MTIITKTDFESLLNDHPELTTHGFGVDDELHYEQFLICCQFLSQLKRRKMVNRQWHSYRLKHVIERWAQVKEVKITYFCEGACVAAGIYLGFDYKRYKKTTHFLFGISRRSRV